MNSRIPALIALVLLAAGCAQVSTIPIDEPVAAPAAEAVPAAETLVRAEPEPAPEPMRPVDIAIGVSEDTRDDLVTIILDETSTAPAAGTVAPPATETEAADAEPAEIVERDVVEGVEEGAEEGVEEDMALVQSDE